MKTTPTYLVLLALLMTAFAPSCMDPCKGTVSEAVGDEYVTIEYQHPGGQNALGTGTQAETFRVYLDPSGGASDAPTFKRILPGYENGKFGPFYFTRDFIETTTGKVNTLELYGKVHKYDYYLQKGSRDMDTLSVEFLMQVDECGHHWRYLRYALNGLPLPEQDLNQHAQIVVVE